MLKTTLKLINELVYTKCGLHLSSLKLNSESVAYGACSFELNGLKIEHRTSKSTPTKTGQFVTIWKRGKDGITTPFENSDDIDFVVITSRHAENLGQFIFPKAVLLEEGIFSQNGKGGKRGIRVYPPWDIAQSKQAAKTQSWQTKYFMTLKGDNTNGIDRIRQLFDVA
ncbi:MAG: MepB family protein [Saprospiraceae bacterium]|nr:MepB family protein [Candidatus Opimibacter skivensis]